MKYLSSSRYGILLGAMLFITIFICSCTLFSKGKYAAELDDVVSMNVVYENNDSIPEFRQIITMTKDDYWLTLNDLTRVKAFSIYKNSLSINGKETPMIFVYDLYLGWAILYYETLEIHKDFSELPKEQALLTKLRMMENPVLEFDGESFH